MTQQQRKGSNSEGLRDEYFRWLCAKIDRRGSDQGYRDLAWVLQSTDFYSLVPHDENRAEDGLKLREAFALICNKNPEECFGDGPWTCSVLEMLIALANRMDFLLAEPSQGDRPAKWFWLLITNLGLEPFDIEDPEAVRKASMNRLVIKKFLERTYAPDGKGGLFPLKRPCDDQRQVEIWYQLMCYIRENFD